MRLRTVLFFFVLSSARVSRGADTAEPEVISVALTNGAGELADDRGHVAHVGGFEWRNGNASRKLGAGFTFSFDSDNPNFTAELACDGLDWATITRSTSVPPNLCRILVRRPAGDEVLPWRGSAIGLSVRGGGRLIEVRVDGAQSDATDGTVFHVAFDNLSATATFAETRSSGVEWIGSGMFTGCGSCSGVLVPAHG